MRKEDIEIYIGKLLKIRTKYDDLYTKAKIIKVSEDTLIITDKFDKIVSIALNNISLIQEEENGSSY